MELLAAKMRDKGNAWNKSTISKIEHGERQLRLQEAVDVIECLGRPVQETLPMLVFSMIDSRVNADITLIQGLIEEILYDSAALASRIGPLDRVLEPDDSELPDGEHWDRPSEAIKKRADFLCKYVSCGRLLKAVENTLSSGGEVITSRGKYLENQSIIDVELNEDAGQ